MDAVWERLQVNADCSDLSGPHRRLQEACEKLGYDFRTITRNTDPELYDPASAAYMGFGDQSGSKNSTAKTYLLDAQRAGAKIISDCRAERILVEDGRAAGVEAVYTDPEPANGGDEHPRRRPGAGRRRRLRLARVPGAAAALADRRPGDRRLPAPAPDGGHHRLLPGAPELGLGPAAGGALARVRQRRRRPRLPVRGGAVDHGADRGRGAVALGPRAQAR